MSSVNTSEKRSLDAAYRRYLADIWLRRTQVLCWISVAAIPTGVVLDHFIYPEHFGDFFASRIFAELVLLGLLAVLYSPVASKISKLLGFFWIAIPTSHISYMISVADGIYSNYYIAYILVIIGACMLLPWTLKECASACLMTWIMYFGASTINLEVNPLPVSPSTGVAVSNAFFMIIFPLIGIASSHVAEGFRFREFQLRFDLDLKRSELEASYKKLAELDRLKSQFFANISHELRTPLTLIISPLENLRTHPDFQVSGKTLEILDIMHGNALLLLSLINDLLDLVHLEGGQVRPNLTPVTLNPLLSALVTSIRSTAERGRVSIDLDLPENLQLTALADKDRIEKVFINLLFNAVKFTPAGGEIHVSGRHEDDYVLIEVKDSGIGISQDNLQSVFSRFWQEDGSSTRKHHGTGIGLALTKELVELQNGTIQVESTKGIGSTFSVKLPKCEPEETPRATPTNKEPWLERLHERANRHYEAGPMIEKHLTVKTADRTSKPLLLVAEDEPAIQRFLELELEDTYEILLTEDGKSAYEIAIDKQPDLILTDIMLPNTDGIALCKMLKGSPQFRTAKVVVLTAHADDRTKLAALEAGADDFLPKPFSTVELRTRLWNLFITAQLEREVLGQNQVLESTLKQLKETETQLIQTERLSALGTLSAGIMHEINNPINFMLMAIKFMRTSIPDSSQEALEAVNDIEAGLKRVSAIIADLRTFAYGGPSAGKTDCDPKKILRTARSLLAHEISADVHFDQIIKSDTPVLGNETQLVQLVVNLLQNALHATASNPSKDKQRHIQVTVDASDTWFRLSVRDNGPGIPNEVRAKIFNPFFTTKPVGEGTGLGLSICHTIVKSHHGEISASSELDNFSEFLVRLPLCRPPRDNPSNRCMTTDEEIPSRVPFEP